MKSYNGPSLPQSILEEIDSSKAQGRGGGRSNNRGKGKLPRKEARKQERQGKKQRKAEYFTGGQPQGAKRPAVHEHAESPQRKKQKFDRNSSNQVTTPEPGPSKGVARSEKDETRQPKQPLSSKKTDRNSVSKASSKKTKLDPTFIPKSRQEEEEDAYIAYLESKLGWKKSGKKSTQYGKGLEDDGLDELLHGLDQLETSVFSSGLGADESEEEIEEYDVSEMGEDTDDDEAEDEVDEEAEEEWGGIDEGGSGSDESETEDEGKESSKSIIPESTQAPATKYIPPHLRNRPAESAEDSEARLKLTRHLKGQLNRMSEQNISTIIDAIEEIYRNHRRHDVTSTITTLIIDGISAHSILLDSYVVLHAAFVSALHKLIGVEFAAYFVQNLVASYEKHFTTLQTAASKEPLQDGSEAEPPSGKETSNLAVLLSELYNFQVISCVLVYDIIRGLLDGELTEFKVELLLKVARNSGQQLRADDPSALKDIIEIVHSKLPEDKNALSSRTRFMVETLTNLKNNKVKKTAAGQLAGSEAVERMKKWLSGLTKKRHVRTHEPLRVSLEDLHSAETKGKWWLVGAAWGGDPLVDRQDSSQTHAQSQGRSQPGNEPPSENKLLKLARKQGMNTDIRRSIFVVLMSSEDYVHACERLSQLKLTEVQQREIIRVILHCCGNEKQYNPYYTLIGQQLCRLSHSHKFTLQYCLWDFLRDLGETNVGGAEIIKNLKDDDVGFDVKSISSTRMSNLARAFGWWIAKDCVTLAILKPVDFTLLKPQSRKFLVQLVMHTFISSQISSPLISSDAKDIPKTRNRGPLEEVFIKTTRIQTLSLGLMYFFNEVIKQEVENIDDSGFLSWANKVALDTLRTGLDVVPTL